MKAVIYARYSSYNQTERSIDGQIEDCIAYAARCGHTVIGTYIDRAKSGTEAEHRTEFLRMIADSAHKNFGIVIVWKIDRFSRNRYDFAVYKKKLKDNGVRVESANEPTSDDPSGILLDSLIEGMAEYYSQNLSQNVKRGLRVARSRGTFTGGTLPFGYAVDGQKKIIPDPVEAPILRQVFRDYADGKKMLEIVDYLNSRGIKPRFVSAFTKNSFSTALSNRKYLGEYSFGDQSFPDLFPRLIDDDTFNAVQRRKDAAKHSPAAGYKHEYLLQGKVFCGPCGSPMIGESGRSSGGNVYHYYTCAIRKKSHTCKKKNERAEDLETDVIMQTIKKFRDPDTLNRCVAGLRAAFEKSFPESDFTALQNRIAKLDRDIDKCADLLISDEISPSLSARISKKCDALTLQKADAEKELAVLKVNAGHRYTDDDYKKFILDMIDGDPLDPSFRRRIIKSFINSVFVYDDKIIVYYNIDGDAPPATKKDADAASDCSVFACDPLPKPAKSEQIYILSYLLFGFCLFKQKSKFD